MTHARSSRGPSVNWDTLFSLQDRNPALFFLHNFDDPNLEERITVSLVLTSDNVL
jgi:hypothetical protein